MITRVFVAVLSAVGFFTLLGKIFALHGKLSKGAMEELNITSEDVPLDEEK